jgi:hypothetical protein
MGEGGEMKIWPFCLAVAALVASTVSCPIKPVSEIVTAEPAATLAMPAETITVLPVETSTRFSPKHLVIPSGHWNCRSMASMSGDVLAIVSAGQNVEWDGIETDKWLLIRTGGIMCWISKDSMVEFNR